VAYGIGTRKYPSNEGRVSGEGVSSHGTFLIPHQFFNHINYWEKINNLFWFEISSRVFTEANEKSIPWAILSMILVRKSSSKGHHLYKASA
jgi:hypothetical protein